MTVGPGRLSLETFYFLASATEQYLAKKSLDKFPRPIRLSRDRGKSFLPSLFLSSFSFCFFVCFLFVIIVIISNPSPSQPG